MKAFHFRYPSIPCCSLSLVEEVPWGGEFTRCWTCRVESTMVLLQGQDVFGWLSTLVLKVRATLWLKKSYADLYAQRTNHSMIVTKRHILIMNKSSKASSFIIFSCAMWIYVQNFFGIIYSKSHIFVVNDLDLRLCNHQRLLWNILNQEVSL